jgi:hypothetical protein
MRTFISKYIILIMSVFLGVIEVIRFDWFNGIYAGLAIYVACFALYNMQKADS